MHYTVTYSFHMRHLSKHKQFKTKYHDIFKHCITTRKQEKSDFCKLYQH